MAGKGVERDFAKAAEWYRKAARQGHAKAQTNLGNLYRSGRGGTHQRNRTETGR